jgi:hypothetical protein
VLPPFINICKWIYLFPEKTAERENGARRYKRGEMETSAFFLFAFEQGRG